MGVTISSLATLCGSRATVPGSPPQANMNIIPLLAFETTKCVHLNSVTWLTFFKGNHQDAVIHIRDRFRKIAEANPWILGRLVRNNEHKNLQLVYPAGQISEELMSQVICINPPGLNIHPEMPYNKICAAVAKSKAQVPLGKKQINKDDLVTRLSISADATGASGFCLVMSMSHTVADGYTFFKIMDMLSGAGKVSILDPTRDLEAEAKRNGFKASADWKTSAGYFCRTMWRSMFFTSPATVVVRRLDNAKIAHAKQHAAEPVSGFDIVASNFAVMTHSDVLEFPVMERGYVEGISEVHAGNYISIDRVGKECFGTPQGIRQFVKTRCAPGHNAPGFFNSLFCRSCGISDISRFTRDLDLPGCEELIKFPVNMHLPENDVGCGILRCDSKGVCVMYSFRRHPDACFIEHAPVGDLVSSSIFD